VARELLPLRNAVPIAAVAAILLVMAAAGTWAGLEPLATAGCVLFAAGLVGGFAIQSVMDDAPREAVESAARDANKILARLEAANVRGLEREIRGPLDSAMGLAGLALEETADAPERAALASIRGAGRDLLESLEAERDLAELEAGTPTIESAPFDLGRALALALRAAARPARGRGVTLRLQMGRSVPPRFVGDGGRVERLVRVWLRGFVASSRSEILTLAVTLRGERQESAIVRFTLLGIAEAPAPEPQPQLYGAPAAPLAPRLLAALGGEVIPAASAGRHALAAFELPLVPSRPHAAPASGARILAN
jgi:hypothetical protein